MLLIAQASALKAAHTVPASKFVSVTLWQPVSLPSWQSGTLPEMSARQLMSLQGPIKQFGGGMTGVVAGSSAFFGARLLARMLRRRNDGALTTLHRS